MLKDMNRREFLKMLTLGTTGLFTASTFIPRLSFGATGKLEIKEPGAKSIPQYGKFEARIDADTQYTNPFDPGEVDIQVHFLAPTGERHVLPAFYDEEDGQPVWKVRYAPTSPGNHRYYAALGDQRTEEFAFECVSSDRDGFIRLSPHDYRYFQFDSGKPYFAVGHNVCWTDDYEHYFRRMADHGEKRRHGGCGCRV